MFDETFKSQFSQLLSGDTDSFPAVKQGIESFDQAAITEFVTWLDEAYHVQDQLQNCSPEVLVALSQWLRGTHRIQSPEANKAWTLAIFYLRYAADVLEHPPARYLYADLCSKGVPELLDEDLDLAIAILQAAAEQEYPPAEHDLASAYEKGVGDKLPQDIAQAEHWYTRAAEHEFGPAMMRLALLFKQKNDLKTSWEWLNKAAGNNVADAHFSLAMMFQQGVKAQGCIIPKDIKKSIEHLLNAAKFGNKDAQFNMALNLLRKGGPIARNPHLAYQFMHQAASGGHTQAQQQLVKYDVFELGAWVIQQQHQIQQLAKQVQQLQQAVASQQATAASDSVTAKASATASDNTLTSEGITQLSFLTAGQQDSLQSNLLAQAQVEYADDDDESYADAQSEQPWQMSAQTYP